MRRVGLVGAGFIARVHAEALQSIPGVSISCVIDPREANARSLARDFGNAPVFASVTDALAAERLDCAHVLVPPDRHADVASSLISAGKPVLLEKPLTATGADAAALIDQARAAGVTLGVNQNFVHHPAFRQLLSAVRQNALGPARHVTCIYNVPLRQIAAGQFSHWMFASPLNLLLEQAVHPLSQIVALAGPVGDMQALPGESLALPGGRRITPTIDAVLQGERLPASLRFAVGQAFPFWQILVTCDDGVAVADILANRFFIHGRTRWLEVVDGVVSGSRTAAAVLGASLRNISDYGLSQLRLKPRSDAFFQSMRGSIAAFHAALDAGQEPELSGAFGADLVHLCTRLAGSLPAATQAAAPTPDHEMRTQDSADLAVLGGTGFIGTHLVRQCIARGLRVRVMARSVAGLPDEFQHSLVTVMRGDIRDPGTVARAVAGVPTVVNLAHGGGGANWKEVREAMVGGAETVARACLAAGSKRLIHVGSIAGLYLGPQSRPITGATPPDQHSESRGDYARAKAVCDQMLLQMHAEHGLPVVILRPGVVVGEGASPFHSALGLFNNDQHCIGWNDGRNPLAFVLVEDVASAILGAAEAPGIEGHCYNLVGDVRPSAREFIAALGKVTHRPLRFHPQSPLRLWAAEFGKWGVKRAGGRTPPLPSLRDLLSRGMRATFDCSDAKRDLGWRPVMDPAEFEARAIAVHAA